jgi:hypothetical protein
MGTFSERMQKLSEQVGHGKLEGRLKVDQVYAAPQERGFWETGPNAGRVIRNHPGGGQTHFLSEALTENHLSYLKSLARRALDEFGLQGEMADSMEDLDREMYHRAPRDFEDLRNSGHPTVTDDGKVVYDRAPRRPRLTEGALREKSRRSRLGEGREREAVRR